MYPNSVFLFLFNTLHVVSSRISAYSIQIPDCTYLPCAPRTTYPQFGLSISNSNLISHLFHVPLRESPLRRAVLQDTKQCLSAPLQHSVIALIDF